jgi:hypothetical protein
LWSDEHEEAVKLLQYLISSAPLLRYFDSELVTEVYTDASDYAIGGWIRQKHADGWHPCVFWSKKMTPTQLNYRVHEKELLALVEICRKHRHWLLSVKFEINMDHESLIKLQKQDSLTRRQARWIISLQ